MSTFVVQLNNQNQGQLDLNPATGGQFSPSIQRSMTVAGPNGTFRELLDGSTFNDCNYWKQYCYPQCSLEDAILNCTVDDGSIWSSDPTENNYPLAYKITIPSGSTFGDIAGRTIDLTTGGNAGNIAVSTMFLNESTQQVQVRLNGSANAVFDLAASGQITFGIGDAVVSRVEFQNTGSGASTATVQVIFTVRSVAKS